MNRSIKIKSFLYFITAISIGVTSCKKDNSATSTTTATANTTTTSATITVPATSTAAASTDSIYILQPCSRGQVRDSIAASALPATITTYLTTNYSGYTFKKAY